MRIALTLAFAAAMTVGLAAGFTTTADAKKAMSKRCLATDNAGKKVSFKCGGDEKCCWQPTIQKGACVPASGICL